MKPVEKQRLVRTTDARREAERLAPDHGLLSPVDGCCFDLPSGLGRPASVLRRVARRCAVTIDVSDRVQGVGPRLRAVGRVALWALVALLFLRGIGAVIAPPDETNPAASQAADRQVEDRVAAFAVYFARSYFADPRGVVRQGHPTSSADSTGSGPGVAQAEVVDAKPAASGVSVVTVACELTTGQVKNLAIPIRDEAGQVTVLGAPYLVAGPSSPVFEPERGAPLSGPDAEEISKLVTRFLGAYASTSRPADLVYFVAPGSEVTPVSGFTLIGEPDLAQLDDEETTRTVAARVRFEDQATGTTYPLRYRLELVKRKRWFVVDVQGVLS